MFVAIFILAIIFLSTLYIQSKKPTPKKIFGVYSQPGKWYYLKFASFFLLLWTRRLKTKLKLIPVEELERMKPLSDHEKAFDATFFQAVSKNGFYFCGGIERRHRAKANGLFYIAVPELGLLESLKLPNTLLDADPGSVLLMKEYSAEGISFTPVEPMKRWYVSFNGKMRYLITPRQNSNQSCRFQNTKEPRQAFQRQTGRRMDVGLAIFSLRDRHESQVFIRRDRSRNLD
jgi:hypothetical protein